jgi:CBS domain-containing protein
MAGEGEGCRYHDEVIMVAAEAGVIETVDKLLTMKIGCLPGVDEEGKLTGMITETDCLR